MQYRDDKYGNKLSILGCSCMRFTKKGNSIDIAKAEKEIMAAYKIGIYVARKFMFRKTK